MQMICNFKITLVVRSTSRQSGHKGRNVAKDMNDGSTGRQMGKYINV